MPQTTTAELLDIWERGLGQHPAERALALLGAAWPDTPPDALALLSLGRRDAYLLSLRERIFGPHLVSAITCPACREQLELTFDVASICGEPRAEPVETLTLASDGYEVRFRLPNSIDLLAGAGQSSVAAARRVLLERCLLDVRYEGREAKDVELPATVVDGIAEMMAEADPQADVELAVVCPACGYAWQAIFDIVSFLWEELNAWATRMLHEVHALASAYGWREADVLALSPWRRQFYLEAVGR